MCTDLSTNSWPHLARVPERALSLRRVGLVLQAVKSATMDLHGSMQEGLQKQEGVLKSQLLDVQPGAQRFEIESLSSGEELAESNEKHRNS